MGRKRTLNRMDFRGEFDEEQPEKAEEEETEEEEEEGGDEEEEEEAEADADAEAEEEPADDDDEAPKPKKKKKPAAPKKPAKRRAAKVVRLRAVWVVFDNSSKQLETFPYNAKAEAEAYIETKNTDKKGCYLQMLKVPLEE